MTNAPPKAGAILRSSQSYSRRLACEHPRLYSRLIVHLTASQVLDDGPLRSWIKAVKLMDIEPGEYGFYVFRGNDLPGIIYDIAVHWISLSLGAILRQTIDVFRNRDNYFR